MTPMEMSRLLGRAQWCDSDEVHEALEALHDRELAFVKLLADQHPKWVTIGAAVRDKGALDALADMGLIVCDPLDDSRWRTHPKVVRVMAQVESTYIKTFGHSPFDDLLDEFIGVIEEREALVADRAV